MRVVVVVVVVVNERAKPDHPHARLVVGVGVWMEGEAGGGLHRCWTGNTFDVCTHGYWSGGLSYCSIHCYSVRLGAGYGLVGHIRLVLANACRLCMHRLLTIMSAS